MNKYSYIDELAQAKNFTGILEICGYAKVDDRKLAGDFAELKRTIQHHAKQQDLSAIIDAELALWAEHNSGADGNANQDLLSEQEYMQIKHSICLAFALRNYSDLLYIDEKNVKKYAIHTNFGQLTADRNYLVFDTNKLKALAEERCLRKGTTYGELAEHIAMGSKREFFSHIHKHAGLWETNPDIVVYTNVVNPNSAAYHFLKDNNLIILNYPHIQLPPAVCNKYALGRYGEKAMHKLISSYAKDEYLHLSRISLANTMRVGMALVPLTYFGIMAGTGNTNLALSATLSYMAYYSFAVGIFGFTLLSGFDSYLNRGQFRYAYVQACSAKTAVSIK